MDIFNISQTEGEKYLESFGLLKYLRGGANGQHKPDFSDLARLHYLALERKVFTVLEFGVGWSTVVLAHALRLNKEKWDKATTRPTMRNNNPFKVFSLDSSKKWISVANRLIPPDLKKSVKINFSPVRVGKFNDRFCHFYDLLSDTTPDFIYLDGPDPAMVKGEINGLLWKNNNRTVMAGDILRFEPTLLPRTFIIVDGRTNNARFLKNNLQRNWVVKRYDKADVTTLELDERPLGKINKETLLYCFGE